MGATDYAHYPVDSPAAKLFVVNRRNFLPGPTLLQLPTKHAIISSGKIGTTLARLFARKYLAVAVANFRGPESLAPLTQELGASVIVHSVQDGLLSSEVVARTVKASNHLPAAQLGTDLPVKGQRQSLLISSNDAEASARIASLARSEFIPFFSDRR